MKISRRLDYIINEIDNKKLIDIGTDHAYIPIKSVISGKVEEAIASDIRPGPIDIAQRNILEFGLQDKIKVQLSDGFQDIGLEDKNFTAVIAGMGGLIICDILNAKDKLDHVEQLILQPQNNIYCVRKKLHEVGYKIVNEIFFCQRNKFYNIINAKRGTDCHYNEEEYLCGKILLERKNDLLNRYITMKLDKFCHIKNFSPEIEREYNFYKLALKYFDG